jgi:hypothetical protein
VSSSSVSLIDYVIDDIDKLKLSSLSSLNTNEFEDTVVCKESIKEEAIQQVSFECIEFNNSLTAPIDEDLIASEINHSLSSSSSGSDDRVHIVRSNRVEEPSSSSFSSLKDDILPPEQLKESNNNSSISLIKASKGKSEDNNQKVHVSINAETSSLVKPPRQKSFAASGRATDDFSLRPNVSSFVKEITNKISNTVQPSVYRESSFKFIVDKYSNSTEAITDSSGSGALDRTSRSENDISVMSHEKPENIYEKLFNSMAAATLRNQSTIALTSNILALQRSAYPQVDLSAISLQAQHQRYGMSHISPSTSTVKYGSFALQRKSYLSHYLEVSSDRGDYSQHLMPTSQDQSKMGVFGPLLNTSFSHTHQSSSSVTHKYTLDYQASAHLDSVDNKFSELIECEDAKDNKNQLMDNPVFESRQPHHDQLASTRTLYSSWPGLFSPNYPTPSSLSAHSLLSREIADFVSFIDSHDQLMRRHSAYSFIAILNLSFKIYTHLNYQY